ncbi:MAG: fumarylacetoacetase [Phycisphaerae bacterium]|nr:fumarylacetoacetase [Phycisphaerae bacterium]
MPSNATHDPTLRSWVESANDPASDFPIQNLPLAAFLVEHDGHAHGHLATVIGDRIVDISTLAMAGFFGDPEAEELPSVLHTPYWNAFAARPALWSPLRSKLQDFLRADGLAGQQVRRLRQKVVLPLAGARLTAPVAVLNYTDFYASKHHAANVGSMFRPDHPLLPNYAHVPIGYHGRASSIMLSGQGIRRPHGQQSPPEGEPGAGPRFGPSTMLDYELEVGMIVGPGNRLGEPVPIGLAGAHILGFCIVNDWSARDMQKWEYQPLGPFLAKNFATSMSPFIVTREAMEPFRVPGPSRQAADPAPLPYLRDAEPWGLDITVEASLSSVAMRERGAAPVRLSRGSFRDMYWTFTQMLTHHTSNGCNLQPGDLLASGTVSGPTDDSRGCLLELTWSGNGPDKKPLPRRPVELPTGETRSFLQDGDEVIMRGWCERDGFRRIGLGECRGTVEAAVAAVAPNAG